MFSRRYLNSQEFHSAHQVQFDRVLSASTRLKSHSELGSAGFALEEAERLCFDFMNLSSLCSELMFGLSASVSDAKSKLKQIEGTFFRDLATKTSAADKSKLVHALPTYQEADRHYNDLQDLLEYLQMKKKDFEMAYYYYREVSTRR